MLFDQIGSGCVARFKLSSAVCPDIGDIRRKINGSLDVVGTVVLLSDAGSKKDHFAVIQVSGIMTPLIVPVDKIETFSVASQDDVAELARD